MVTTTTAFPYTGIPSTEVAREPGHTGMAEHGTDITKHLLQDANDRVERGAHEAEMQANAGWAATGAQMKRQALQVRDVAVESADNLRGEIRAHPLLAVFTGIVVGVLLGRVLR
ncbi:hypothetical protein [Hydrogenophaga sp.]|uniref:hypothetical protein n=1 Tax=Hydrogenophaga sp. TaxID=1904254 RepID=UPI002730EDCA|nr:hypothetical protein [Hydrogenophaga sp.]MDP2074004.1 hypothetical protein [Hydrogenophaga sp.]MDP3108015.1 hypothetical protein [Hydrogenophaga sp.]MDP3349367.1 hypothetical protein [Hydrogenophaga sp.]MDZ4282653.1 hypothetical protein [Hydrogenophaga sp.]MDZ4399011.1 hypothetical protein [Hydrogenophaga sp.]